jgi:hypothetical protein
MADSPRSLLSTTGNSLGRTFESYYLPISLQLRNELIALLDDIVVLLILVIRSISFNHIIDSVYGAWNPSVSNKVRQIPSLYVSVMHCKTDYGVTYLSKYSTETPKSLAMLFNPTTR